MARAAGGGLRDLIRRRLGLPRSEGERCACDQQRRTYSGCAHNRSCNVLHPMVMMAGLDCHDASPFGYLDAMETQSAHAALIEINIAAIVCTPRSSANVGVEADISPKSADSRFDPSRALRVAIAEYRAD